MAAFRGRRWWRPRWPEAEPAGRPCGDDDGECQQWDACFLSASDSVNRLPQVEGREQLQTIRQEDGDHAGAEQPPMAPKARAQYLHFPKYLCT